MEGGHHIHAVTFDVGGTLLEPRPSVGAVYSEVAASHGYPGLPPAEIDRRFTEAWRAKVNFNYSQDDWRLLVERIFSGLIPAPGNPALFEFLYARFSRPAAWKIFEDVLPALEDVRQRRLKIGVISNWDERLRPLLAEAHLSPFFDTIAVSQEIGRTKPAPQIFQHAASLLGIEPRHILHIGDNQGEDCEGAEAAGMRALLLSRKATQAQPGTLRTLAELKSFLDADAG